MRAPPRFASLRSGSPNEAGAEDATGPKLSARRKSSTTPSGSSISMPFLRTTITLGFPRRPSDRVVVFLSAPLRTSDVWSIIRSGRMATTMMLKTIYTPTFTEAAPPVSVFCRHLAVNDGRRTESARTLAERCAR